MTPAQPNTVPTLSATFFHWRTGHVVRANKAPKSRSL